MAVRTPVLPYRQHDHAACVEEALAGAAAVCSARGARLTPLREAVLALVWQTHKPLGAYAILDQLNTGNGGRRPAPPTVYRALEFLLEQGLIHRINALNAYLGCRQPEHTHAAHFLICRRCGTAVELADHAVDEALQRAASRTGFRAERGAVEILGLCPNCQAEDATGDGAPATPDAGHE